MQALATLSHTPFATAGNFALAANVITINPAIRLPPQYERVVRIAGVAAITGSIGIGILTRHIQDHYTRDVFFPGRGPSKIDTVHIVPSRVRIRFSRMSSIENSMITSLAIVDSESSPGSEADVLGDYVRRPSPASDFENLSEYNAPHEDVLVASDGSDRPYNPSSNAAVGHNAYMIATGSPNGDDQSGGSPPPPPPPSSTTSGVDDKDNSPSKSWLFWKYVLVALAVFAGLLMALRRRKVHTEVPTIGQSSTPVKADDDADELVNQYRNSSFVVKDMSQASGILETILAIEVPLIQGSTFWEAVPSTAVDPIYTLDDDVLLLPVPPRVVQTPARTPVKGIGELKPGVNPWVYLIIASLVAVLSALVGWFLVIISKLEKTTYYREGELLQFIETTIISQPEVDLEHGTEAEDFVGSELKTADTLQEVAILEQDGVADEVAITPVVDVEVKSTITDHSPATVLEGVISKVEVAAVEEVVHSPPSHSGLNRNALVFVPRNIEPQASDIPVFVGNRSLGRRRRHRRRGRGGQEASDVGSPT
ncbi:hypothetical protein GALMADRAFT_588619 [Galerina marginata CBS 339.88]|uniref:Uncharacterized protein n=1 Tax=Galerina marginata (strain CBS 339.88) TaxID=685588 RepID=A0A067T686_GALM3|nr:hypothetical protein GALMADRAFT_588619 [Galerina marginata CBS 339.88]